MPDIGDRPHYIIKDSATGACLATSGTGQYLIFLSMEKAVKYNLRSCTYPENNEVVEIWIYKQKREINHA